MKKDPPIRRPTKLEELAKAVEQDYAHQNTIVINGRRRVLQCEAEEADKSIVAMTAAMANLKERRAKLQAMIAGLGAIVAKR